MNPSDLALLMLQWETRKRELEELEHSIKLAVLVLGKSQTVGNVRATYSAGRKKYDYQGAVDASGYSGDALRCWRKVTYDYRQACKDLEIDDIPFTQSPPSVSIKLLT